MSYLDPKERVIDLQLTSYGKYLLSIGTLDPVYYAFFDDDIIYDGEYANISEKQSEIEPRIQENTPRFSVQTVFSGRELEIFNKNPNIVNDLIIGSDIEDEEKIEQGLIKVQDGPEHNRVLQQPLGRSNPFYKYSPAWNAQFLKQPLSASTDYWTISGSQGIEYKNIPQLNADIRYKVHRPSATSNFIGGENIGNKGFALAEGDLDSLNEVSFSDGSGVSIENDAIIIQIEESNTFFENENFDLEFFEVMTINGKEHLTPLKYNEAGYEMDLFENNHSLQNYMIVRIDGEIYSEDICPYILEDTTKDVFTSTIFDCGLEVENTIFDTYNDVDDTKDICE